MKSRTLFLAAVLTLCLGAMVSAQQTTVEGTVVSNSGGTLVLNTAEGTRTFLVDGQTSVPATLAAGTRVTIEYQTTSDNQMHAFKVTPAGPPPATTTDTTTADATGTASTAPAATTTAPEPPPATGSTMTDTTTTTTSPSTAATQPTTAPSTPATDTTTTAPMTADTSNERLPATASPLPLIALVGTLALAAGVALRFRHA